MISIDWGTRTIYVPKAYTALVSGPPNEIREMDINTFRLDLKSLESSDEGMGYPITHNHNTEVLLGGVTYARIVEMINGYTVTFEDGQYAINLIGANSNIADVVNVNQTSVRSFNAAGLIVTTGDGASPADIATAVWNHTTGATLAVRMAEAWGRLGLDPTKPLVTGNTEITFGDIVMALTEIPNQVTLTRQ